MKEQKCFTFQGLLMESISRMKSSNLRCSSLGLRYVRSQFDHNKIVSSRIYGDDKAFGDFCLITHEDTTNANNPNFLLNVNAKDKASCC